MSSPLLRIENLHIRFHTDQGPLHAVRGLNLDVEDGKITALVGESGCGKSVTALSILRLLDSPPAEISRGRILFKGTDLLSVDDKTLRAIRGNRIAMIFQEPMTSLNPVFTVGEQIAEVLRVHEGLSKKQAIARAVDLLIQVGIPDAGDRAHAYPHALSGGMRQRVMIAMAIACHPDLLIADEPTTALDVTVQAQILELLLALQAQTGMGILLITHDLGVVAEVAHRVAVMYAGEIIEEGNVDALFTHTAHPYTRGLLRAVPRFGHTEPLAAIPGRVPRLYAEPHACVFKDRCAYAQDPCGQSHPALDPLQGTHIVRCLYPLSTT